MMIKTMQALDLVKATVHELGRMKWHDIGSFVNDLPALSRLLRSDLREFAQVSDEIYGYYAFNTADFLGGARKIVDLFNERRSACQVDIAESLERTFWESAKKKSSSESTPVRWDNTSHWQALSDGGWSVYANYSAIGKFEEKPEVFQPTWVAELDRLFSGPAAIVIKWPAIKLTYDESCLGGAFAESVRPVPDQPNAICVDVRLRARIDFGDRSAQLVSVAG